MLQNRQTQKAVCGALSCIGIASTILWCMLMGHTPGFLLASAGLGTWANARVFWLLGIIGMAFLCLILPRATRRADAVLRYVIPLIAVTGAGCFALSFHQDFFDPHLFAALGIVISGFGYFWFISRFVLLLSLTQGFVYLVWAFALAFPLRQVALVFLDAAFTPDSLVAIAIALPILSAVMFEVACWVAKRGNEKVFALSDPPSTRTLFGVATIPREGTVKQGERRFLIAVVVAMALLLSVVRACSMSGAWGDDHTENLDLWGGLGFSLIMLIVLSIFSYVALIRTKHLPVTLRFQVGFLLVISGLFLTAMRPQLSMIPHEFIETFMSIDNSFALLLFWSATAVALDALDVPANRVVGAAGMVYAVASVAWVLLIDRSNAISSVFILVAVYALFAIFMGYSWYGRRSREVEESAETLLGESKAPSSEVLSSEAPQSPEENASHSRGTVVRIIEEQCEELASTYGLSHREKDVLILLAQGRTGTAIQEELVIAGSTVKTHVQHIYKKVGVADRQELMDRVLGKA